MNEVRRVKHPPRNYGSADYKSAALAATLLVALSELNPQMYDEILCRIAIGIGGYRTVLTTTKPASDLMYEMEDALLDELRSSL